MNIKFKLGIDAFISDDICICFDIEQDTIGLNIKEKSIFYRLTFSGVSNFKMIFDSGDANINQYPVNFHSDCLYIYDLQIIESTSHQIHWRIDFCDKGKQSIDLYAGNILFSDR